MDVLAQPGDTWGIPGSTFLIAYLVTAALIVVGTLAHRLVGFAGRRSPGFDQLHPLRAAYLNGGDRLAIYTALGGLRSAGSVGVGPDRALAPIGPMPPRATPLDQAVYNAAGRRVTPRALSGDQWVSAALADLRAGLERDGLAPHQSARRAARLGPALLFVLLAVGVLRLVAGISGAKPVGFLVLALVGLTPTFLLLAFTVPRRTRAARAALRSLRRRHNHLAPMYAPAYASYGAAGAAMGDRHLRPGLAVGDRPGLRRRGGGRPRNDGQRHDGQRLDRWREQLRQQLRWRE